MVDHSGWMYRYGRERPRSVTSGEVFLALSREPAIRAKLGEVYRKLFEGEGVRQGSSPDHFVYVTPGKARAEISEVSAWIRERFGDPAGTVPARTPFGYLSGRYDGWVTLFAALAFGGDRELAVDFTESVARMSWSTYETSRTPSAGTSSGGSQQPRSRFLLPYGSGEDRRAEESSPPAPEPGTPKPGFLERIFGAKSKPPPPPPPRRPTTAPFTSRALDEEIEEEPSPEEEAEMDRAFQARVEAEAEERVKRSVLEQHRTRRDAEIARREARRPASAEEQARHQEMLEEGIGRWSKKPVKRKVSEVVGEEDETQRARARALLDEQARLESLKRKAEEEAKLSTAEKLRRPPGTTTF